MSKRKYKQGTVIGSMNALLYFLEKDDFVYVDSELMSREFIMEAKLKNIRNWLKMSWIERAIKIDS